ncbi:MAG: prolipoprotein diacylglyceryl transferase [Candidatus Zixiibacteriota bacterium]
MHPELFRIGPVPIKSYGLMLAISFLLGIWYVYRVTKRDGKPFDPYLTIASLMIFSGVVGARLFYVVFHLEEFKDNWLALFGSFDSHEFGIAGLNLYGGVLTAIVAVFWFTRRYRMNLLEVFDYFSPTLGLGLGITRIGCFLNGCCFGTPTELPWGISFPPGSIPYSVFQSLPLHPSQLYSSLYGLLLFLLLHFMMKRKKFIGQLVAVLFMVEALFRFTIESVRYYEDEMVIKLGGTVITYNQIIAVGLFVAGIAIYLIQRKRGALPPRTAAI